MRLRQTQTGKAAPTAHHLDGAPPSSARRSTEGDDLHRARYFCLKAGQEMAAIIDADRTTYTRQQLTKRSAAKGRDPVWLCERLGIIQREAKRARARAVYRSAQDALGLIQRCNAHMPIDWTRVDGRLFVLNKLLGQYEAGLLDVESKTTPDIAAAAFNQTPAADPDHSAAKQTLSDLLPHASADEKAALSRLMTLGPAPALETKTTPPVTEAPTADRIEWIMADLVQKLLELGREYAKIFSVSHALDDVLIEAGSADTVTDRLYTCLSDLIASNLPIQGVGRIDISASGDELLISGSGFDAFSFALPERAEDSADIALETLADDIEAEAVTPPRPPMITEDNEAELRAQLAALMDVGMADLGALDR